MVAPFMLFGFVHVISTPYGGDKSDKLNFLSITGVAGKIKGIYNCVNFE
jgi:hypothetical protein